MVTLYREAAPGNQVTTVPIPQFINSVTKLHIKQKGGCPKKPGQQEVKEISTAFNPQDEFTSKIKYLNI